MAKDIDFTKYIVPQEITENGYTITDKISILDKCENKTSLARKKLSDFDMNYYQDYTYESRLRQEYDASSTKIVSAGFVPIDRKAVVSDASYSFCPTLTIELPFKVGSFKGRSIFGKIEKVKDGDTVYHTINVGAYPQSKVSKQEEEELAKKYGEIDGKLVQTGKLYTIIHFNSNTGIYEMRRLPEFEYKGKRYIYDGTCREWGKGVYKVEPLKFRIYGMTTSEIKNAKKLNLVCDKIFTGIPYYPNNTDVNCAKWQNSMIRAFVNSANSRDLDKDPNYMAKFNWDFSTCGLLYEALNQAREPLREVTFSSGIGVGKGICQYALHRCDNIEKINILPGIEYISKNALTHWKRDCNIKELVIPASVVEVQDGNFEYCDQVKFEDISNVKVCGDLKYGGGKFDYVYIAKDGSDVIYSRYEDNSLEEDYIEQQSESLDCIKRLYKFYKDSLNPSVAEQEKIDTDLQNGTQPKAKKKTNQNQTKITGNGLYEELQ